MEVPPLGCRAMWPPQSLPALEDRSVCPDRLSATRWPARVAAPYSLRGTPSPASSRSSLAGSCRIGLDRWPCAGSGNRPSRDTCALWDTAVIAPTGTAHEPASGLSPVLSAPPWPGEGRSHPDQQVFRELPIPEASRQSVRARASPSRRRFPNRSVLPKCAATPVFVFTHSPCRFAAKPSGTPQAAAGVRRFGRRTDSTAGDDGIRHPPLAR